MKIVLDTNVLASGIFFNGPPAEILRLFSDDAFSVMVSHEILQEYQRVIRDLSVKFKSPNGLQVLESITLRAKLTLTIHLPKQICSDPTDDKFIAAAISGKADRIISGDKHLLTVSEYKGVRIINPRTFLGEII